MACLADDGVLPPGKVWRQEGILGTVFQGSYQFDESEIDTSENGNNGGNGKRIVPTITGSAHVTAKCTLIFDPADPFRLGVPA
jgi:4-hydroxyproline epimerase